MIFLDSVESCEFYYCCTLCVYIHCELAMKYKVTYERLNLLSKRGEEFPSLKKIDKVA